MCQLSPIAFHGDTIFCLEYEGQPFTPMRPIVENLGLAWQSQAEKLSDNRTRWTVTMIMTVAQDGKNREMLCLPLRKLPAWFASIHPNKVRHELREKIELYQNECDDALWNYWINGKAEREQHSPQADDPDAPISPADQNILQAIIRARVEAANPATPAQTRGLYGGAWSRFNNHFRLGSYRQLPHGKMAEAVAYLVAMPIGHARAQGSPKALPKAAPNFEERCLDPLERLLNLRCDISKTSIDLNWAVMGALNRKGRTNMTEQQQKLAEPLCKAMSAFFMAINNNLIAVEEMFMAYREADALINGQ